MEIANLKEKLELMEMEVAEAQKVKAQKNKQTEEVQALKIQSEGILTKAKAMIFENTKVIKNQELQIEALGQQNESLRDVVNITKDLLEIRNLEVKQLEDKINVMDNKVKAEKERQDLLHRKLETMIRHNGELKREYETQLCLFNALRDQYHEKRLAEGIVNDLRQEAAEIRAAQQNGESSSNQENVTKEVTEKAPETSTNESNTAPNEEKPAETPEKQD